MSEIADEEFDGFSQNEVDASAQWYNDRLEQIGIGELDVVDSENEPLLMRLETDANKQICDHPDENKSPWVTPTVEEMKAFLGLCFLMGINVKPDIKSYWTTDFMLETLYFSKVMVKGSLYANYAVHPFSNSEQAPQPGDPNYSKLYKIESLINMSTDSMVNQYIPKRQL
ncbi:unnamed protein product [Mytilus edulis]|uniref:PiggyBac transposable element-derived protein domain-containing protein n=1 Tax=Mytilus edulis TaxID=6550 RepID=A0A8S3SXI0_MYTED|nr:unnamed protein product [Mytilus edulis]